VLGPEPHRPLRSDHRTQPQRLARCRTGACSQRMPPAPGPPFPAPIGGRPLASTLLSVPIKSLPGLTGTCQIDAAFQLVCWPLVLARGFAGERFSRNRSPSTAPLSAAAQRPAPFSTLGSPSSARPRAVRGPRRASRLFPSAPLTRPATPRRSPRCHSSALRPSPHAATAVRLPQRQSCLCRACVLSVDTPETLC
jgi:hypothetical protein